jgi:PAS domain S-box-containing protein
MSAGSDSPGRGSSRPEKAEKPEALARDTGELQRLLIDSIVDYAIFALDKDGYVLSWNAGARRFKGYEAHEIIGKHFSVFYPKELVEEGFPAFELRTAANTGRFEDEGWRVRKDGTRFWANVVITALRDKETGELLGFGKVTRDLTERREAEESLRESEERFRLLVDSVKDYAIFMLDPTGHVATWNAGAERAKGYRAKEIIGKHFSKFYTQPDLDAKKPERELEIATRTGKYEEEGWRVRKDGSTFWANVLITAIRNKAGELVGFAKVTRDLTERREAEERALESAARAAAEEAARQEAELREKETRAMAERLQEQTKELELRRLQAEESGKLAEEARQRADAANKAKSEFLAAMSHELRTPLNAIGGYAELLTMGVSGTLNKEQQEHVRRLKRSQEHLLGIINEILNFSRIEAGQLKYDMGVVPINDVVDVVHGMMLPQAEKKQVSLVIGLCQKGTVAWADRAKVEQIVLNLVSNAVKFTQAGGQVEMSCDMVGRNRTIITVKDNGCGIAEDQLDVIFDPFVQVGRTLTSMREGAGLGLAISRDLAEAMDGSITVKSTLDVGSEFTLTLPRHGVSRLAPGD